MRYLAVLVCAACGSGPTASTTPTTPPTTTTTTEPTAPAPTTEPAAPAAENDASVCASRADMFGPFTLTAEQAARRRGQGVTKLSAARTTQEKPLEVCGVPQQRAWIAAATCEDGSHPLSDPQAIAKSRKGSVGVGGTCGTIIDLYVVPCPEASYQLHLDMYHCGPGESFM